MIRNEERDLDARTLESLEAERAELETRLRRFRRLAFGSVALVLVVGIPLAIRQWGGDPTLGILAFATVGVYAGIVLWVYVTETPAQRERLAGLTAALEGGVGRSRVTRCTSRRVVAVEELDDEGPGYFFEVGPEEVYYLGGQHFELDLPFPNDDFEIVEGYDGEGRPVSFEVRCHGRALRPERTISLEVKLEILAADGYPEDGDLLPCGLDDVEDWLLGRSGRSRRESG